MLLYPRRTLIELKTKPSPALPSRNYFIILTQGLQPWNHFLPKISQGETHLEVVEGSPNSLKSTTISECSTE